MKQQNDFLFLPAVKNATETNDFSFLSIVISCYEIAPAHFVSTLKNLNDLFLIIAGLCAKIYYS